MIFDNDGIKFSNEVDDDSNQVVIFVIKKFNKGLEINKSDSIVVYFPFDLNNEYYELESKIENSIISFYPPMTEIKVNFKIDFENEFFKSINIENNDLKYLGNFGIDDRENSFLIVRPIDLKIMDKMYFQTKGIFVGLTPTFRNPKNDILDF